MFCTITETSVKAIKPTDNVPPQYPGDYFGRSKGTKPTIRIPQSKLDLQAARELVKGGLSKGELSVKHGIRYLYLLMCEVNETMDGDWESFGVVIGKKGENCNPLSMFNIIEEDDKLIDGTKNPKATPEDDKWMALAVISMYRLGRTTNQTHRNTVITKLNAQMQGISKDAIPMIDLPSLQSSWVANQDFCKIVAGIDMFFNKHKMNDWAYLRFGSIPSRFKDCSALLSLGHICDVTGMDLTEFLDWIFVGTVAKEVVGMMKEGNEIDNAYSYTPYMMDMGLSLKSPYSSTVCPGTYTLVHMIGTLLFSDRSKHAKMISENNLSNIRINSEVVAYVKGKKGSLVKAFIRPEFKDQYKDDDTTDSESEEGDEAGSLPRTDDPMEWFAYLEYNHFDLPDVIKEHTRSESRKIQNTRAGTIGNHVVTTFN
ncbi:N gene product [Kotonkan virus]|uniref:Nucleoprotein n=1 Tax=Kotonkan virus TaxID=318836 RepID=H8XWF0_9RHAB|nr:N gene product [Kotonkan virus]AEI17630.1 nucleoprotein [Kotonkan virus]